MLGATTLGQAIELTTEDGTAIVEAEVEDEIVAEIAALDNGDSTEAQEKGELIDGLRLDDIRWGDHGTHYRIVFDLSLAL